MIATRKHVALREVTPASVAQVLELVRGGMKFHLALEELGLERDEFLKRRTEQERLQLRQAIAQQREARMALRSQQDVPAVEMPTESDLWAADRLQTQL